MHLERFTLAICVLLVEIAHAALNAIYDAGGITLENVRSRWLLPQRLLSRSAPFCFSSDGNVCPLNAKHTQFRPVSNAVWYAQCFPEVPPSTKFTPDLQEVPVVPWTQFQLEPQGRSQNVLAIHPTAATRLEALLGYDAGAFGDAAVWLMAQQIAVDYGREPYGALSTPRSFARMIDVLDLSFIDDKVGSSSKQSTQRRKEKARDPYVWRSLPLRLTFPPVDAPLPEYLMLGDVTSRWLGDWWGDGHGAELRGSSGTIAFSRPIVISSIPMVRVPGELLNETRHVRIFVEAWIVDNMQEEWIYSNAVMSRPSRRRMWDAEFSLPTSSADTLLNLADLAKPSVHLRITGLTVRFGLYRDEDGSKRTFRRILDIEARVPHGGPTFRILEVEAARAVLSDAKTLEPVEETVNSGIPDHLHTAIVLRYETEESGDSIETAEWPFAEEQVSDLADLLRARREGRLAQNAEVLRHFWDTALAIRGLQQPLVRFWFGLVDVSDPLPPPIASDGTLASLPLRGARKVELLLQRHVPVEADVVPLSFLQSPGLMPRFEVTEATTINLIPAGSISAPPIPTPTSASSALEDNNDDVLAMFSALRSSLGALARLALRSRDAPIVELQRLLESVPPGVSVDLLEGDGVRVVTLDISDSAVLKTATKHVVTTDDTPAALPVRHRRADVLAQIANQPQTD